MKQGANATGDGGESDLTIIREQTRECLELLRALVSLLVNKPEREGPTLEDLIAALVAQQRDALVLLRQIATDQGAILDRLPTLPNDGAGPAANGHAVQNGTRRS
ncbi:MAG: hypothetical protein J0H14_15910 [Alphaproteobacteria bacterium]|nr:hypothetical protein [Alphaproteobacteria bacterium]